MYAVTVKFQIHQEHMDAFLPLMRENAETSLRVEEGCHRFDICHDPDQPSEVFLYELYNDEAAFQHHLQTPHFRQFSDASEVMIAGKSVSTYAQVIS